MTTRDLIDAQKRRVGRALTVGIVLALAGMAVGVWAGQRTWASALFLPGFLLSLGTLTVAQARAFRCPRCRENMAATVLSPSWYGGLNPRLRFCPYCGVGFDEPASPAP